MNKKNEKFIRVTPYGEKKNSGKNGAKIDIYSKDPKKKPHDSVHIEVNTDNKTYKAVTKIDGKKESSSGGCFLTTACMKHYLNDFDDNCYELTVLRWFRDNYVSKEDIDLYYQKAPLIVEAIEAEKQKDLIYDYIYDNIVDVCVEAIEKGDYNFAYNRYKSSILSLEHNIVKPYLANKHLREILFKNYFDFPITDKTVDHIKNNPQMYVNCPTRIFLGKVYRDSEYQGKKKKVLEIQLP